MNLKKETVARAYSDFGLRFGWPAHSKDDEDRKKIVKFDHAILADMFSEEGFADALMIAKAQARKFPCVADFYRGYDAPSITKQEKALKKYSDIEIYNMWDRVGKYEFYELTGIKHEEFGVTLRRDIADLSALVLGNKYKSKKSSIRELLEAYGY